MIQLLQRFLIFFLSLSIHITVIQANQPPIFTELESLIFLPQDTPVGSNVTVIEAADVDNNRLVFSITGDPASSFVTLLQIQPKSAILLLNQKLNRTVAQQFSIPIEVTDGVNVPIRRTITIYVIDNSNHAPSFNNLPSTVSISEDSPVDTSVFQVQVSDPDSGNFGLVTFSLKKNETMFTIDKFSGLIILSEKLSYSIQNQYSIPILATDGGGLNTTSALRVVVLPTQKRPPYFINNPYFTSIYENTTLGTRVLQVTAVGAINGLNDENVTSISYSIEYASVDYFSINSSNGWITTTAPVDRDQLQKNGANDTIVIIVQAVDANQVDDGQMAAVSIVKIHIMDINDQIPTFCNSLYNATVSDVAGNGQIIYTDAEIIVKDYDKGNNGIFSIRLDENSSLSQFFRVEPAIVTNLASLKIFVNQTGALRKFRSTTITLRIIAEELFTGERFSSHADIRLTILPSSCPKLSFVNSTLTTFLQENPARGTFVTKIEIIKDEYIGTTEFFLYGSKSNLFSINKTSGDIYVAVDADMNKTLLNFEQASEIFLVVGVRSLDGLEDRTSLEILLIDVNDEPPRFCQRVYVGVLDLSTAQLEYPLVVSASDADGTSTNNRLTYGLMDENNVFFIDPSTGEVGVRNQSDWRGLKGSLGGRLNITISVWDSGKSSLNDTANLFIQIKSSNVNAPKFSSSFYMASILETAVIGTSVITVTANYSDLGETITYSISSGSKDVLTIDPTTGLISTSANLNLDLYNSNFNLTVLAVDSGCPSLTGTATVIVKILDVNNKPPKFSECCIATLAANADVSSVVMTCKAEDSDTSSLLHYRIQNGSVVAIDRRGNVIDDRLLEDVFTVNESTGSVKLMKEINRNQISVIHFTLMLEDINGNNSSQTASTQVTIYVEENLNKVPQLLTKDFWNVPRSLSSGSVVGQLLVSESSFGGTLFQILPNPNTSPFFTIPKPGNGLVILQGSLLCLESSVLNLPVMLIDRNDESLNSTAVVNIHVDGRCYSLKWVKLEYEVWVNEGVAVGQNVTRLVAGVDGCPSLVTPIIYSIFNSSASGPFYLDPTTGVLTIQSALDREITPQYNLTVQASITNNAFLSDSQLIGHVIIKVKDINDHAPVFNQLIYTVQTSHDVIVGDVIASVRATDADEGINAVITYSIVSSLSTAGWDYFTINPSTGVISLVKVLSPEILYINLTVKAEDRGTPPLFSTMLVMIYLTFNETTSSPHIAIPTSSSPILVPTFNRLLYPPPVVVQLTQGQDLFSILNLNSQRNPDTAAIPSCYYIVGGNSSAFKLDKQSGILSLSNLDSLTSGSAYDIIVQILTDFSLSPPVNAKVWDETDASLQLIRVIFTRRTDVGSTTMQSTMQSTTKSTPQPNCGGREPYFTKESVANAVAKQTQPSQPLLSLQEYLCNKIEDNKYSYTIDKPVRIYLNNPADVQTLNSKSDIFKINQDNGLLSSNIYFQETWDGYFVFGISLVDFSKPQNPADRLNVTINLLSDYNRLQAVFQAKLNEAGDFLSTFPQYLTNVTGGSADFRAEVERTGQSDAKIPDSSRTEMIMYGIDSKTGLLLNASDLLSKIENMKLENDAAYKQYHVLSLKVLSSTCINNPDPEPVTNHCSTNTDLVIALAVVASVFFLSIIVACIIACIICHKYKRKLRSANAVAAACLAKQRLEEDYHSNHSATEFMTTNGVKSDTISTRARPIWLEQCGENYYMSYMDYARRNSIDDNIIADSRSSQQSTPSENRQNIFTKKTSKSAFSESNSSSKTGTDSSGVSSSDGVSHDDSANTLDRQRNQDTEVKSQDTGVNGRDTRMGSQDARVAGRDTRMASRDNALNSQDSQINSQDTRMNSRITRVSSRDNGNYNQDNGLTGRDSQMNSQDSVLTSQDNGINSRASRDSGLNNRPTDSRGPNTESMNRRDLEPGSRASLGQTHGALAEMLRRDKNFVSNGAPVQSTNV